MPEFNFPLLGMPSILVFAPWVTTANYYLTLGLMAWVSVKTWAKILAGVENFEQADLMSAWASNAFEEDISSADVQNQIHGGSMVYYLKWLGALAVLGLIGGWPIFPYIVFRFILLAAKVWRSLGIVFWGK